MVRYNFLIIEEVKVLKANVWVIIQKYKRHGTVSCLPGSGRPALQRVVRELCNSHLSFGNNICYVLMIT